MEAFLHYLWASRRWARLVPTGMWANLPIEVIDPGRLNYHAGPDFLEAQVRIGDIRWCGAVEIHRASAEWYRHGHDQDPAYSSVILHVVEADDRPVHYPSGEGMPTCLLLVPEELRAQEKELVKSTHELPCARLSSSWSEESRRPFLACLYRLRLRRKVALLHTLLARSEGDWAQAGYALLLRYLGFGLNGDAFELLASYLPLHLLEKHRDDLGQLEALLLGTAGLLSLLPEGEERAQREAEYAFLSHKYALKPLSAGTCRRARTRSTNLPEYRLLQLATLLANTDSIPELLRSTLPLDELEDRLRHPLPSHWLGGKWRGEGMLSSASCLSLYVNAFLPYRLAYEEVYTTGEKPLDPLLLLGSLPAEENRVTRLFDQIGSPPQSAWESQALLELHERCCLREACSVCPRREA